MKRKANLTLLATCVATILYCQQPLPIKEVLPPAPDVSSMEKYGSVPTTPYTGLPEISIPLYIVKSKSIEVPISLSYHAQGIKVNDISGSVGIGWVLNAGGYLTKEIRGKDDANYAGGGYANASEFNNIADPNSNGLDLFEYTQLLCARDNEPDLFSYSLPSGSGKFFYDKNGVPHLVSAADFTILDDSNPYELEGHEIIDGNGIRYYFNDDDIERQNPSFGSSPGGIGLGGLQCHIDSLGIYETAKLSGITSFDGGSVEFIYEDVNYKYLTGYTEVRIEDDGINEVSYSNNESWSGVDVESKRLKKIVSLEGYGVSFEYSGDGPGIITKVEISYKDKIIKVFNLNYGKFATLSSNTPHYASDFNSFYNSRDKLISINESGRGSYKFSYNETPLPPRFSFAQDYWGYYNGANSNTSLIPNKDPDNEFQVVDLPGDEGNRDANFNYMRAGILTKVTYPTGASTEFRYDAHRETVAEGTGCVTVYKARAALFDLEAIDDMCTGFDGGNTVGTRADSTITIPANATNIKVYYYTNMTDPNTSAISCANQMSLSSTLLTWNGGSLHLNEPNYTYEDLIPDGTTSINVEITVNGFGNVINDSNAPGESNLAYSKVIIHWQEPKNVCDGDVKQTLGGLRLRSQVTKIEGVIQEEKYYSYREPVFELPKFYYEKIDWYKYNSEACWDTVEVRYDVHKSNPIITASGLFGSSTAYKEVTEYIGKPEQSSTECLVTIDGELVCDEDEPANLLGKVEYVYTHTSDEILYADNWSSGIRVDKSHLRGLLESKTIFGYNSATETFIPTSILENEYAYLNQPNFSYVGVKIEHLIQEKDNNACNLQLLQSPPAVFDHKKYFLKTNWVRKQKSTQINHIYSNNWNYHGTDSSTIAYSYNSSNYQLASSISYTETQTKETTYEYDFIQASSLPTSIETSWVSEDMDPNILIPVNAFEGNYSQDVQYSGTSSMAGLDNQNFLAYSVTSQKAYKEEELVQDVTYVYDDFARIEKLTNNIGGLTKSYGYSDDPFPYPSAECIGCEDLWHFSFESEGGATADNKAISGAKARSTSTGTPFTYTVAGSADDFEVRYWYKPGLNDEWELRTDFDYTGGQIRINLNGYVDDVTIAKKGHSLTTYVHEPGVGVSRIVDENLKIQTYTYDAYGRLIRTLDSNEDVVNQYQYNYKTAGQ